ncbi:pseudouridine synthase [Lagierella sp.]|uniref:pseudouridine synthase n=1 Tax=Lagierella sp. TaxID=2849657 RepID=UPI00261B18DF|nr:pseudouridine synthase [Lagierella sp.]
MRINKFLAHSGICSRRKADNLIEDGRVKVNGKRVVQVGLNIKKSDIVEVDGKIVEPIEKFKYYLLNKPLGFVSTVSDPFAKKTVIDLIDSKERLYPVGRLDKDSRGLIIITNDGDLTYKLTHPKKDIYKTYHVILDKKPSSKGLKELIDGIFMDGFKTKKAKIKNIGDFKYQISISEGRNRQVRRMFQHIGCEVLDLKRVAIGKISDSRLPEGKYRILSHRELEYLRSL